MKNNNEIDVINIYSNKKKEVIDISEDKEVKRTRLNKKKKEEYINIKISKTKLKKAIISSVALVSLILVAKYGYNLYTDYQEVEQQKQEFINDTIENDNYLDNLVVYVNDAGFEIRYKNQLTGLQDLVRNKDVADYINDMDLTEEEKEVLAEYFGVQSELSSTHKNKKQ